MKTVYQIAKNINSSDSPVDDLFRFIVLFCEEHRGNGPNMREMAEAIDIIRDKRVYKTSKQTIKRWLVDLEDDGRLDPGQEGRRGPGRVYVVQSEWVYHGSPVTAPRQ